MNNLKMISMTVLLSLGLSCMAVAEPSPTNVVVFDHAKVDEAFAKGLPLLINDHYKIMAGRHVTPGNVEVHEHDTDIFYVTAGSATFVTGGTLVNSRVENPGEIRAEKTTGGTAHHLTKGDVIVIPKGTPHWFTEVSGTFLYFVVKVTG